MSSIHVIIKMFVYIDQLIIDPITLNCYESPINSTEEVAKLDRVNPLKFKSAYLYPSPEPDLNF